MRDQKLSVSLCVFAPLRWLRHQQSVLAQTLLLTPHVHGFAQMNIQRDQPTRASELNPVTTISNI
jgi:hypothetical protein